MLCLSLPTQTTPWQFVKEYMSSSQETCTTYSNLFALQHLHFHHLQQPLQPSTHRSLQSFPTIFQSRTRFITRSILKPSIGWKRFRETHPNLRKNSVFYPYLGLLDRSSSGIIFYVNC